MFQIGDTVLYGTTGVCRVEGVIEKEIARIKKEYYVLHPVAHGNSAVFVPVDNPALLAKVKRILSKEEICALLQALPAEAPAWIEDNVARREAFHAIVQRGDRSELIQLVRTVYRHQKELSTAGKRLHLADERIMKEAERLLHEEFSVALEIAPDEVVPFIAGQLEEA